jgi:hypothetical protein
MQNKIKLILVGVALVATALSLFGADSQAAKPLPGSLNMTGLYDIMPKTAPIIKQTPHEETRDTISPVPGQQLKHKPTN